MRLYVGILLIICLLFLISSQQVSEGFQSYDLPKIIWTHWNGNIPPDVQRIIDNNRVLTKPLGWTIHFLNDSTMKDFIPADSFPKGLENFSSAHKADWYRLKLLSLYGGLWMDSGIIINDPTVIEDLYTESYANNSDLTGYYIDANTTNKKYPVIENWFIMVPKQGRLILDWLHEFETAIRDSFIVYKANLILDNIDLQRIYSSVTDTYLTQHASIQAVLQKRIAYTPTLILLKAEDGPFKIHCESKWDAAAINKQMNTMPRNEQPGIIKLRGSDRKGVDLSKYFD